MKTTLSLVLVLVASIAYNFNLSGEIDNLKNELLVANTEIALTHDLQNEKEKRYEVLSDSIQAMKPGLDLTLNTRYTKAILDAADEFNLPEQLILSVAYHESRFAPRAHSYAGARGIMQVMPFWAKEISFVKNSEALYTPETSFRAGAYILAEYLTLAKGDTKLALLFYNRGPAAVYRSVRQGKDPSNGYDKLILKTYWS